MGRNGMRCDSAAAISLVRDYSRRCGVTLRSFPREMTFCWRVGRACLDVHFDY